MNISVHRRNGGFSLVEIMVAVIIGLLGMLVIFQVFETSEGFRRTTTSGGDAQQNGAIAMYVMERELRQAGWGFNNLTAFGCSVLAYDDEQGANIDYTLVPVSIVQGAATGSDTIEVNYGNQESVLAPIKLTASMVDSADPYVLTNRYGFKEGDVFVVVEPGQDCTLAQVTDLPAAPLDTALVHKATDDLSRYNHPTGSGVEYSMAATVFNLGTQPVRNIYTVNDGTLVMVSALASPVAQPVADGIVQMRAQYGHDNGVNNGTVTVPEYKAGDGIVDSFDNVTPTDATGWSQVLAVRVGIVARSGQPERANDQNLACDATTAAPAWMGGTFDLTADPNWQCYRYRVFQTTIPMRNMLWSQG